MKHAKLISLNVSYAPCPVDTARLENLKHFWLSVSETTIFAKTERGKYGLVGLSKQTKGHK